MSLLCYQLNIFIMFIFLFSYHSYIKLLTKFFCVHVSRNQQYYMGLVVVDYQDLKVKEDQWVSPALKARGDIREIKAKEGYMV